MIGEKGVRTIADVVLAASPAAQTEVLVLAENSALTRFANSHIHQNVAETNAEVRVRAVLDKRIGVASTNDLRPEGLKEAANSAVQAAELQRENPDFRSLPGPEPVAEVGGYFPSTAGASPQQRAEAVGGICGRARAAGLEAYGALTTAVQELGVINSLGIFAYHASTLADLKTVVMGESGSGWAQATCPDLSAIDASEVGREAVQTAQQSQHPREIGPGSYTAILQPYAVEELLFYLAYMGLGATAFQEGRSFMSDRIGDRIAAPNVSLWDDGLDPDGLLTPFDHEGMPKRRVDMIRDGIARGVVYDSYTAGREEGRKSTGHALPAPNPFGPFPSHMVMASGETTLDEMVQDTEHGVLITRLWYVNPVHPRKAVVTGMTRDGTFLIEKGEIVGPVKNLRFTQSILEMLRATISIGRQRKLLLDQYFGSSRVPALKVGEFQTTGATVF